MGAKIDCLLFPDMIGVTSPVKSINGLAAPAALAERKLTQNMRRLIKLFFFMDRISKKYAHYFWEMLYKKKHDILKLSKTLSEGQMDNETKTCSTCRYLISETDRHGDITYYCGRYPPTIINSTSPAVFPKILAHWHCGEYCC